MSLKRAAQLRSQAYASLARAFLPPEEELFNPPIDTPWLASLKEAGVELGLTAFSRGVSALGSLLAEGLDANNLEGEYHRLFTCPGPSLVYPYASCYLEGLAPGEEAGRVLEEYRRAGLSLKAKEPPDHLALELEFLSYLCVGEVEAWEEGEVEGAVEYRSWAVAFLKGHVLPWAADFCRCLGRAQPHPFYSLAGSLLHSFLVWEEGKLVEKAPQWELKVKERECDFCMACLGCPRGAIFLEREDGGERLAFDPSRCNGCRECLAICPQGALALEGGEGQGVRALKESPLVTCSACGRPLASAASLESLRSKLEGEYLSLCQECRRERIALPVKGGPKP